MIVVRESKGLDCRQGRRAPLARVVPVVAVFLGLLAGSQAQANVECITPDNGGGSVDLPPFCPGGYLSPDEVHMVIDNADPGTTIILDATHDKFIIRSRTPGGSLGGEVEVFDSFLVMNMTGTGALSGFSHFAAVPVSCEVHTAPRTLGDPVQSFDTEMVQLQGNLGDDGVLCNFQVVAGPAFGLLPSPGHTTLTQQPSGDWAVDSFFDVTYQIDFQGCPAGPLAGLTFSNIGTIRMQAGLPRIEPGDDEYMTIDPTSIHFGGTDVPTIPMGLLGNVAPLDVVVNLTGGGGGGGAGTADTVIRRLAPLPLPTIPSNGTIPTEIVQLELRSIDPIQVDSFFDVFVHLDPDSISPGSMTVTRTDANGGIFTCETQVNAIVEFRDILNPTAPPIFMPTFPLHLSTRHTALWSHTPPPDITPSPGTGPNFYPRGIEHEDIGIHMQSDGRGVIHNINPPEPPKCYFGEWPNDGTVTPSHVDFGGFYPPIPPNFFAPGSDAFPPNAGQIIRVDVRGEPLDVARTGGTTTITQQTAAPMLPSDPVGTMKTVDVEIIALSLVSIDPITVTYPTAPPELWDVAVALSPSAPPGPTGTLTAQKMHDNGGTFSANFQVQPVFTFTRQSDGTVRTFDTVLDGIPPIPLEILDAPWVHFVDQTAPGLPGGVYIGPGQTFVPGIEEVVPGDRASQQGRLVTADEVGPASNVTHLVCPPPPPPPPPPPDPHQTVQPTQVNFGPTTDVPPIPAGFFGPGSDPFQGSVQLEGDTGGADTLVQRSAKMNCPDIGSFPAPCDPIPIEIVELNLRSSAPITVTGTQGDTQWDVKLQLSGLPSSLGTLTATKEHCNGGTFDGTLFVRPRFTFTNVVDPLDVRVLDYAEQALAELQLDIVGAPWVQTLAPHIQGIDAPNDGDFVPGVAEATPCDPATQTVLPVTWNSPGGGVGHSIDPPPVFCPLRGDPAIDPCAALQASECQGSTTDECRPLQVQVAAGGTVSGLACTCITPGSNTCGPIDVTRDPLGLDIVSCSGACVAPTGPCLVFVDRNDGLGPVSTGQASWPATAFNANDILSCDCEPAPANEACCAADGTCQNLPASQCLAVDGTPRGPGTACAGVDADGNGRDDACEFDQPCQDCGPGAHWIDTCPGGLDYMPSGAPVGIDLTLDCIQDQTLVLQGPVAVKRGPGSPHQIDTEIVSMSLTGGGVTLRAGAGNGQGGVLPASLGSIIEQNADPTQGDSSFDVFFELDLGGGQFVYNHQPLTVSAKIPCVPPDALYFHPISCIPLYTSPTGFCSVSGAECRSAADCDQVINEVCNHGTPVSNLTSANHDTFPTCGTPTADGQGCAQFKCTDGTTDPCQPRCAEYDPVTGITNVVDCDCRPIDECHADFTPATGGIGGLRAGTDNPCTRPDDGSGTITLPPEGCAYLSAQEVHTIIGDPPITVQLVLDPIHKDIFCRDAGIGPDPGCPPPGVCEAPGGALGGNTDCFTSDLHLVVTGSDPPLAGYSHTIDVPVSCLVYSAPRTPGDPVQSFDTEMFRLQGDLIGDPDFCQFHVVAGRQFGLPSPGQTTLTQLPSGDFQVDSFFDITYQIDFQGCTGGPLDGYVGSTTGTIHMATGTPPSCVGGCPVGEICNERRDVDPATGLMTVCCDCIPEPTGACCRGDGTCAVTTASNCAAPDQYLGDGTVCQGMGACCLDNTSGPAQFETCQMMDGACCAAAGGIFDPGGTCTTVACCLPGGFCEDLDPECCAASGGVNSGVACAAVNCAPQDCQIGPTGLCEQVACPGGATDQCQAKCVNYDPKTNTTTASLCDCIPGDDCYVVVDQPVGGLRGGGPCVIPDASGTVVLPPTGCDYLSPDEVHMIVAGLPVPTTIELDAIHKDFVCGPDIQCSTPPPPGALCESSDGNGSLGGKVDCFGSTLDLTVRGTGILGGFSRHLLVPVQTEVHTAPRTPGDPVQDFDTEMFRLSGGIFGDPDFCTFQVTGGSDFGLPSPGHTTLTQLPSGEWAVDSFFDITYQIDFQGCPGSILEGFGGTTEGTIRMETGGMPGCSNTCPAGTVCEQTKTFDSTTGTFEVCCNCVAPVPTPVPARPPFDRKMNRTLAWDPNTGGRALANPIAYRVELKQVTQGSCTGTGGFCRVDRKECSISGSSCTVDADCAAGEGTCSVWSDCNRCSIDGNPCITASIDCAPGQTCDPSGEQCVNDAPDVGGTSVGKVWWVGPECPPGSGQHLLVPEAFRLESTNWPSPTLAGDCETVPEAVYGVRAFDVNTATLSGELPIATTVFAPVSSSFWADCVGPLKKFCGGDINGTPCTSNTDCVAPDTCDLAWTLPDGAVNFDDVNAALWAITLPTGFTIPPIEWVDLHGNACGMPGSQNIDPPNRVVNFSDIAQILFAFQGRPYTFADAADCPARTRCGGLITGAPCTSDADCTAPDTCKVVCCSQ